MIFLNQQNTYKIFTAEYKKSDTIVIDNGTYELKAGYLGDKVAIKFLNCFFKDSEGLKFENSRGKNKYTPFTYDMISGFHVLEENLDQIFEYLDVKNCKNLIITDAIYSPTKKELLTFLFEVYHFDKIQIGVDAIYSFLYNKKQIESATSRSNTSIDDGKIEIDSNKKNNTYKSSNKDNCNTDNINKSNTDNINKSSTESISVIISCGHSATYVYVLDDTRILEVYKINYGGKFALNYLSNLVKYKFKEYKKDYSAIMSHFRCAIDYDKEVLEMIENMKNQNYETSVCISEVKDANEDSDTKSIQKNDNEETEKKNKKNRLIERLKNMNKKKSVDKKCTISDAEDEREKSKTVLTREEDDMSDSYENDEDDSLHSDNNIEMSINTNDISDNNIEDDNKKKVKGQMNPQALFKMRIYQFNTKIQKALRRLKSKIEIDEEEYLKITDLPKFLDKKKKRYESILRELEIREKCRKDVSNRKTYEFGLLLKTGGLTTEETVYKNKIKECADLKIDEKLSIEKADLLDIINLYDPSYIVKMSTTFDLVSCKNINKTLLNIDLLRIPEVLWEPSILGSNQMGLGEILENILRTHRNTKDVFLTGGFSQIHGLKERIEYECRKYSYTGDISVTKADNPVEDVINGACFSKLFQTYTYKDFTTDSLNVQEGM